MRRSPRARLLAGLAGLALAAGAGAAEAPEPPLRFNPFQRPGLDSGAPGAARQPGQATAGVWTPVLRGTLVAGEDSLANLGGVVLRRGEETHGYRLVDVRPFEAVFVREGEEVVLPLVSEEESP